jgi:sugar/nucleoside kinase (ribokinase family)
MKPTIPRFLIAGQLSRDYVILPSGETLLDIPGGNALYAGVGLLLWEPDPPPAIIARVGEDYPQEWINQFERWGLNIQGISILPEAVDVRSFTAFGEHSTRLRDDPVVHFGRLGLQFPKALLGYKSSSAIDSRTSLQPTSLRQGDIPSDFLDSNVVHLCPSDYLTHSLLPALLRQAEFSTVTLDPSTGYMNPTYWDDVPALLTGLTAFLPAEDEIRTLFQGHSSDLWEMAEALASYGCEIIVIKCGERGQLLYDASSNSRWEIPSYSSRFVNPIGAGDSFCGGFLAGYRRTFDPLEAVLFGNISASLVVEGHQPNYALDVLPGLPEARLDSIRQSVRKI